MRAAALAVVLLAVPVLAAETVHSDDWYAVYVNGTKAGHARTRVVEIQDDATRDAPANWQTDSTTLIVLKKGGDDIRLVLESSVLEAADGRVAMFRQSSTSGGDPVVTVGRVVGDRIELRQNDAVGEVAYPQGAVGPVATDRRVAASGFGPGTTTEVLTFSSDVPGEGARMTFTVGEVETLRVVDRNLKLHRIAVRNEASASRRLTMWMDGTATMQVSESDIPNVGILRMVRTTERLARAMTSAVEIGQSALVTPDRGIPSPRRAARLVVRLSREDGGDVGASLAADAHQAIGALQDDGARDVTITVPEIPDDMPHLRRPVRVDAAADDPLAPCLAPSAYIESDDAAVRDLAAKAVGDATDALECARRIGALVRSYVADKSMDVGFATAAEVVRSREGDCTEHAVLVAALARAVGLPSRIVTGIVYVPAFAAPGVGPRGAFAYHMWAEILIARDHWHPVDAALGGFDATHIAVARSDLAATSPTAHLYRPLMAATAGLRIQIVEVR